jgi:trans-aconitate methyltransferase
MKAPANVPSINDFIEEYDQRYRNDPNKWAMPERDAFMADVISRLDTPESIIDIGCGNGHSLAYIDPLFPETDLYGIDLSMVALEQMMEKIPRATPIHGAIEDIADISEYDISICLGTAEHFIDLMDGLCALRKVTKKYCYMELPNNLDYSPGEHTFRKMTFGSKQWEWHLPRDKWEELFEEAGFSILESYSGKRNVWEFIWVLE